MKQLTGDEAPCSHLCYCERGANRAEIERLQDAKRRALAIADERAKENVGLRAALKPFADWIIDRDASYVSAGYPDACHLTYSPDQMNKGAATVGDLRRARRALEQREP